MSVVTVQFTSGPQRCFECDDARIVDGLLVLSRNGCWQYAHTLRIIQWVRLADGKLLRGEDHRADGWEHTV